MPIQTEAVPIKMSEVILEFADDLLEQIHNNNQRKKVIQLACFAWNLALMRSKKTIESEMDKFLHDMGLKNEDDQKDIKDIVWVLIEKKWSDRYFSRAPSLYKLTKVFSKG